MAESAVRFLLGKLTTIVENEIQFLGGVREEVLRLRGQLDYLRAFVMQADATEESDEELRVWVRQVRDVAFDAEDVLDEYQLLQTHDHGDGISGALCRLSCCIKRVKSRYRIASELKELNSRIGRICEAYDELRKKFRLFGRDLASMRGNYCCNAALLVDTDVVGVEERKNVLLRSLMKGGLDREVLSVVGMGGVGKTTLAKLVFADDEVAKHFKVRAWLSVSQPFKLEFLLKDMLRQLHLIVKRRDPEDVDSMNNDKLVKAIKDLLQKRKYLIVLDCVCQLLEWNALKHAFPNNQYGSRIIVTTRNHDVASISAVETGGVVYNLKPLSEEQSWALFCRKTFGDNPCPSHLVEICRNILHKCEGLPLAIVAVSGALAKKDTRRIDEWRAIQCSLNTDVNENDQLQCLRKVLSLSFNDLPYYLKTCFLYLSIFPEHHEIEQMKLIRLWIAEGFVEEKEGKELEDVAEDYAKELLNRSLIQVATMTIDGRVKTFRIHDLLRQIIISKSRDQNFATIFKGQNLMGYEKIRRLSIHNTLQNLQQNKSAFRVRSLFMFGVTEEVSVGKLLPYGLNLLNVVHLEKGRLKRFPTELCDSYHLKYLSLRYTNVKSVPKSIGNLRNLETLDLKHCYVCELPVEIQKLQRLRHLLVYRYEFNSYLNFHNKFGFKTQANIGLLRSLQKICFIEADQGHGSIMTQLGKLSQLRRLGITKLRKVYGKALCAAVEGLTSLCALSIVSIEEEEIIDLQHISSPLPFLERLYLRGRLKTLPPWISSLHGLARLHLKWSKLHEEPLLYLQHLPNLVHLQLCQVYDGEKLCFRADGFKKLKLLNLDTFEGLRCIELEVGTMPVLECLVLQRCKLLERVPSGIEGLSKLKRLEFFDMPEKFIKTLQQNENGSDHWKISHIPEVHCTYWKERGLEVYSLRSSAEEEDVPQTNTLIKLHELESRWK